ncbi:MAG TPA: hypothetical protein VFI91_02575 [Longimicrobiaceae bacterium]|nr:hypothetical protein [Longimicrobiaceae bacterium]
MTKHSLRKTADKRLDEALAGGGARDHRDMYRDRLKALRTQDESAFRRALEYYDNTLVPNVAREGSDPLSEWLEYGRFLADLAVTGTTVQVDSTGRAKPYEPPAGAESLILHLPTSPREAALAVGIPLSPSPAQMATYQLLARAKLD